MRRRVLSAFGGALASAAIGCAGGAPLLHPAHVLDPGLVSMGAGVSGEAALRPPAGSAETATLERLAIAPGVAPWVAGRVGIAGSNEAGLTYTARAVRADVRHAFDVGTAALSLGVGASVLTLDRPGIGDGTSVYGGGADVPILFGVRSRSDLYAAWVGARTGFELLSGGVAATELDPTATTGDAVSWRAKHVFAGGVAGLRAGFRHIHVAVEIDAAFHHAWASAGAASATRNQVTLTPAGALVATF